MRAQCEKRQTSLAASLFLAPAGSNRGSRARGRTGGQDFPTCPDCPAGANPFLHPIMVGFSMIFMHLLLLLFSRER
jgi:hypothetical protein